MILFDRGDRGSKDDAKLASMADLVHLRYTHEEDGKVIHSSETFILDNGRIKLDVVKQTFSLTVVRLWVGEYILF